MANRYWVYNGGNINDTTHWSATSGGAGGASKPTLSDNVIFDANSFTLNAQVVTLNEAFNCLSIDWTGITKTVTISSSVYSLNLYGNLTLATGLTWTFTGTAYLNHKSSGTVTTNGIILNANRVYFDAAGITVTNGDAANYGVASFYLTNGTWNTSGKTITSTGSFNTVAGTKVLTLGASVFNIGTWTNTVPTGFTFNVNTSTVVIITASILTGITTFYNLTCSGVATLTLANNITVTNALTLAGSSISNRLKILSSVAGTQRTVTVPAAGVFPSNLDVQDMAFTNAVDMSAISGYSQDFGNNTGIAFTTSANLFFKHTSGSANWGDITKWVLADRVTQGRIPLIQDDVNFDNLSFTGTSTLSLNVAATCRSMDWTGLNQAVTLSSAVNSLSIYGHTTLAAGLIWTFTGTAYTYMKAPDSRNILTNGIIPAFNKLYFDRIGGSWTNQDDFNAGSSYIGLTNGTWNTNGKTIVSTAIFETLIGTKTLTLGASLFKIGTFSDTNTLNLTLNYNTSTVWITVNASLYINSSFFYNLKVEGNVLSLLLSADIVIYNILTLTGSNSNTLRLLIASAGLNYQRKITANSLVCSNVNLRDISGLGAANWDISNITGKAGDCGGNSNINFTQSLPNYWVGNGGNWSDINHWASISGGANASGRTPLPQDDVIFDELSFSTISTVNVDTLRLCKNLDMTGVNKTVVLNCLNNQECYGSFILGSMVAPRYVPYTWLYGRGSYYINTFNAPDFGVIRQGISTSSYIFIGDFKGGITNIGSLYANGHVITNTLQQWVYLYAGTFYLGTGTLVFSGGGLNDGLGTLLSGSGNLDCGEEGTIIINDFGVAVNSYNLLLPSNRVYNKIIVSGAFTGILSITGSNIINELIIDAGKKVRFTAGTTTTIGKLTAIGTQAQPITIGSDTAATHNLIKTGADMVEVEYCNISNSNATPSDKWAGGDTSVDGGGNSGWTFKYIPIIMWFFGIFSKK